MLIWTLHPFLNWRSKISITNQMYIIKSIFQAMIFYVAPMWAVITNSHINKLQAALNKILKIILNLPWQFSTSELHGRAYFELVAVGLKWLNKRFNDLCEHSMYSYINDLIKYILRYKLEISRLSHFSRIFCIYYTKKLLRR